MTTAYGINYWEDASEINVQQFLLSNYFLDGVFLDFTTKTHNETNNKSGTNSFQDMLILSLNSSKPPLRQNPNEIAQRRTKLLKNRLKDATSTKRCLNVLS